MFELSQNATLQEITKTYKDAEKYLATCQEKQGQLKMQLVEAQKACLGQKPSSKLQKLRKTFDENDIEIMAVNAILSDLKDRYVEAVRQEAVVRLEDIPSKIEAAQQESKEITVKVLESMAEMVVLLEQIRGIEWRHIRSESRLADLPGLDLNVRNIVMSGENVQTYMAEIEKQRCEQDVSSNSVSIKSRINTLISERDRLKERINLDDAVLAAELG